MRTIGAGVAVAALLVGPGLAAGASGPQGKQQAVKQFRAEDGLFSSPNYSIEGRISKIARDKITISRDDTNLPAAELSLASNSKLRLDGDTARPEQLRSGQQVTATFNLQGNRAVALEVSAQRRESGSQARSPWVQPPGATGGQEQQAPKSVVGTVQSVQGDTLSLKNQLGETHEFSLGNDTRYTRGGQSISKDQIQRGDEVRAAFRGEQGNLEATEIIVMSKDRTGEEQQEQQKGQKQQ